MLSRVRTSLGQMGINAITRNLIILISFALPILILYVFDSVSFESAWGGRTPLLIFLWLLLLEVILGWKKLLTGNTNWTLLKIVAVVIAAVAPTLYVIGVFLFGLRAHIVQLGQFVGVQGWWYLEKSWALSLEYFLFAVFLASFVWLMYRINGLKRFSISLFFLAATGFFYMADAFYPSRTSVILQAFGPWVASSAVYILNLLGYNARLAPYTYMGMPILLSPGLPPLAIGWPCAGVQSLFIYTFVILLFLRDASFSLMGKIFCVAVGAIGTFLVNVLRIVTICIIGTNIGSEAMNLFHSYFGELFFITWIMIYLLAIIYSRALWAKLSPFIGKLKETGQYLLGKRSL